MIPLEDTAADIIGKAQRGLQISDSQLAERANIGVEQIRAARDGGAIDEGTIGALAPVSCSRAGAVSSRNKLRLQTPDATNPEG